MGRTLTFGMKVFRSTLRSQILFYASVFTFSVGLQFFEFYQERQRREKNKNTNVTKPEDDSLVLQERIGQIIGFNLVQCLKSWMLVGIGAVCGSFISPGFGTLLGINMFPLLGIVLLDELLKPKKFIQ